MEAECDCGTYVLQLVVEEEGVDGFDAEAIEAMLVDPLVGLREAEFEGEDDLVTAGERRLVDGSEAVELLSRHVREESCPEARRFHIRQPLSEWAVRPGPRFGFSGQHLLEQALLLHPDKTPLLSGAELTAVVRTAMLKPSGLELRGVQSAESVQPATCLGGRLQREYTGPVDNYRPEHPAILATRNERHSLREVQNADQQERCVRRGWLQLESMEQFVAEVKPHGLRRESQQVARP